MISGGARLVDQDRVDLVDDREMMAGAATHLRDFVLHVVAQVVEAEFVVGAVGDVAGIGGAGGPRPRCRGR